MQTCAGHTEHPCPGIDPSSHHTQWLFRLRRRHGSCTCDAPHVALGSGPCAPRPATQPRRPMPHRSARSETARGSPTFAAPSSPRQRQVGPWFRPPGTESSAIAIGPAAPTNPRQLRHPACPAHLRVHSLVLERIPSADPLACPRAPPLALSSGSPPLRRPSGQAEGAPQLQSYGEPHLHALARTSHVTSHAICVVGGLTRPALEYEDRSPGRVLADLGRHLPSSGCSDQLHAIHDEGIVGHAVGLKDETAASAAPGGLQAPGNTTTSRRPCPFDSLLAHGFLSCTAAKTAHGACPALARPRRARSAPNSPRIALPHTTVTPTPRHWRSLPEDLDPPTHNARRPAAGELPTHV
jgi:hypothetical protein